MKINFVNRGSIDLVSGGYIYNKNIIKWLSLNGFEVEYTDNMKNLNWHDITIIDSLMIREMGNEIINAPKKPIGLIHMINENKCPDLLPIFNNMNFITTGSQSYNCLIKQYNKLENEVAIVSPGINKDWKKKTTYNSNPISLLVVANYLPGKGYEMLLESLALNKNIKWKLSCYGNNEFDPEYYKSLLQKSKSLNLTDRITFNGSIAPKLINSKMIDSDLLLHFSESESFGMVIQEAIHTGLPVIMYKTGEWQEFTKSNQVLLVDKYCLTDFSSALHTILTNENTYRALCTPTYQNDRSWDTVGLEIQNILIKHYK
ncbi:MAG: glycosyltransferase [Saprospiraceae bacterium]